MSAHVLFVDPLQTNLLVLDFIWEGLDSTGLRIVVAFLSLFTQNNRLSLEKEVGLKNWHFISYCAIMKAFLLTVCVFSLCSNLSQLQLAPGSTFSTVGITTRG